VSLLIDSFQNPAVRAYPEIYFGTRFNSVPSVANDPSAWHSFNWGNALMWKTADMVSCRRLFDAGTIPASAKTLNELPTH
jgi:hypothetical protein